MNLKGPNLLIVLSLLLLSATSNFSQTSARTKSFEIEIVLGGTSSGPAEDIEKVFIKAGLNDELKFFGVTKHPFSRTGFGAKGVPWFVNIGYALNDSIWIHLHGGESVIGETSGFKDPYTFFSICYSVVTISPMLYYKFGLLKAGAGPALFFVSTGLENKSLIGLMIDIKFQYPSNSIFFISGSFQYRFMKDIDLGPYRAMPIGNTQALDVPGFTASVKHSFVGLGLGLRL